MEVKIDVSENVRFVDRTSVLGIATDDKKYKNNIVLLPKIKKRINKFAGKIDKIHCILIYYLIKNELKKYESIQICCDISPNEIPTGVELRGIN